MEITIKMGTMVEKNRMQREGCAWKGVMGI